MKTLIVLSLILAIAFSIDSEQLLKEKALFRKLRDTNDVGRDIMTTIQLELLQETSNEHIMDTVVKMLEDMKTELTGELVQFEADLKEKKSTCDKDITQLKGDIEELDKKIKQKDKDIPLMEEKYKDLGDQEEKLKEDIDSIIGDLKKLEEVNIQKIKEYNESKEEHNRMIGILEKAKEIIMQLSKKTSFLQMDSPSTILSQLSQHEKEGIKTLKEEYNQKMFKFFMQLAQNTNILADQEMVKKVIQIIDDLIAQEKQAMGVELEAEDARKKQYETDKTRYQTQQITAEARLKDHQADMHSLDVKIKEAKSDRDSYKEQKKNKEIELEQREKICKEQIEALEKKIATWKDDLATIEEVIKIMKSKNVQQARDAVKDLDADDILKKENQDE